MQDIFSSMTQDKTLNAGPEQIATDESLGIGKKRNAKKIVFGVLVVAAASIMGYSFYVEGNKQKPALALDTPETAKVQQETSSPVTPADLAPMPTEATVTTQATTPIEPAPVTASMPVDAPVQQPQQTPPAQAIATQTQPAQQAASENTQVATQKSIEQQLEAILPSETAVRLPVVEKKKPVKKVVKKQEVKPTAEKQSEPAQAEEAVTSEQILIYSE